MLSDNLGGALAGVVWVAMSLIVAGCSPPQVPAPAPALDHIAKPVEYEVLAAFKGLDLVPQIAGRSVASPPATELHFSPSGRHLLAIVDHERANLWDVDAGVMSRRFMVPYASEHVVRIDTQAAELIVGAPRGPVYRLDLRTMEQSSLGLPKFPSSDDEFSQDGRYRLVTIQDSNDVFSEAVTKWWDLRTDTPAEIEPLVDQDIYGDLLAVLEKGRCVAYTSYGLTWGAGQRLHLHTQNGDVLYRVEGLRRTNSVLVRGEHLIAVTSKGEVMVYRGCDPKPVHRRRFGTAKLLDMSRDGLLALLRVGDHFELRPIDTGKTLATFRLDSVADGAVAPDGKRVAFATAEGIVVFDVASGATILRERSADVAPRGAALSEDGSKVWLALQREERVWLEEYDLNQMALTKRFPISGNPYKYGRGSLWLLGRGLGNKLWWYSTKSRTIASTVGMEDALRDFEGEGGEGLRQPLPPSLSGQVPRAIVETDNWLALLVGEKLYLLGRGGTKLVGKAELGRIEAHYMARTPRGLRFYDFWHKPKLDVAVDAKGHIGKTSRISSGPPTLPFGVGGELRLNDDGSLHRVAAGGEDQPCVSNGTGAEPELLGASPDGKDIVFAAQNQLFAQRCGKTSHRLATPLSKPRRFQAAGDSMLIEYDYSAVSVVKRGDMKQIDIISDAHDWAIFNPKGIFAGSADAGRLLAASDGLHTYAIDQYALYLNRPDELLKSWGHADDAMRAFFRRAADNRLRKSMVRVPHASAKPPVVEIVDMSIAPGELTLSIKASSRGGEKLEVLAYVDGTVASRVTKEGETFDGSIVVAIDDAPHLVEVAARDAFGLESIRLRREVTGRTAQSTERLSATPNVFPWRMAFSPDGRQLATLGWDGELSFYERKTLTKIRSLRPLHDGSDLAWVKDEVLVLGRDRGGALRLKAFDGESGKLSRVFEGAKHHRSKKSGPPYGHARLIVDGEYLHVVDAYKRTMINSWHTDRPAAPAHSLEAKLYVEASGSIEGGPGFFLFGYHQQQATMIVARQPGRLERTIVEDPITRIIGARHDDALLGLLKDGRLATIDEKTMKVLRVTPKALSARSQSVQWMDERHGMVVSGDGPPQVVDVENARILGKIGSTKPRTVAVSPDRQWVAFSYNGGYVGAHGLEVLPLKMPRATPPKRLFFVGIGAADYDRDELDLEYSDDDAVALRDAFARQAGFDEVVSVALTDKDVDAAVLDKTRKILSRVTPNDTVVLFLSGHGVTLDSGYWYLPTNVDPQRIEETAINFDAVEELLQQLPARRKLLLLDTCASGEPESAEERRSIRSAMGQGLRPRGVTVTLDKASPPRPSSEPAPASPLPSYPSYRRDRDRFVFRNLARRTGAVVMSASAAHELALETDRLGHGLFTAGLLAALVDADGNQDGRIDVRELETSVRKRVAGWSAGRQNPRINRENIHADINFKPLSP